jgi:hypothetical protein
MASTIKADTLQSTTSNVFVLNSVGTEYARFDSSGNFQLANPSSFPAGTAAAPSITATGDTNTGIFFPAADTIAFSEGGVEAMRIDSSGNVGIGTSSPSTFPAKFAVSGSVASGGQNYSAGFSDAVNSTFRIGHQSGLANLITDAALGFYTSSTERMRISSGGLLQINTTSSPYTEQVKIAFPGTQAIHCNDSISSSSVNYIYFTKGATPTNVGAIFYNGSVMAYQTTSDYRLKENVAPMTGALSKIAALKPVTYTWKDNQQSGEGFLAHELQEHFPDAVSGTKDEVDEKGNPKYQGMDASILISTMVKAIQEQQVLITAQAATITALTARIAALESTP